MRRWRCRRLSARLVDLVDGLLPEEDRSSVERHLEVCADCSQAVDALREVPARLIEIPAEERDEQFWLRQRQDIMRQVRQLPEPGPLGSWVPLIDRRMLVPAMALLLAVAGYWVLRAPEAGRRDTAAAITDLDDETMIVLAEISGSLSLQDAIAAGEPTMDAEVAEAVRLEGWGGLGPEVVAPEWEALGEGDLDVVGDLLGMETS